MFTRAGCDPRLRQGTRRWSFESVPAFTLIGNPNLSSALSFSCKLVRVSSPDNENLTLEFSKPVTKSPSRRLRRLLAIPSKNMIVSLYERQAPWRQERTTLEEKSDRFGRRRCSLESHGDDSEAKTRRGWGGPKPIPPVRRALTRRIPSSRFTQSQ